MDLRGVGDRLIAIRLPSYAVRHHDKVAWFLHHHRPAFDLWGTSFQDVEASMEGEGWRGMLRSADDASLRECTKVFTNSQRVSDRLTHFNGLDSTVLYPPLWKPERYGCVGFSDTVVYPSRIVGHKRQELLVRALAHTTTPVRVQLLGTGSGQELAHLRRLASELGVEDRLEIEGRWVSEQEKQAAIARCLAVAYLPVDEDGYGYPCLEAAHSRKPVLTTTDSGATLELVQHRVNGLVVQPHPIRVAAALDELYEDRAGTEALGARSEQRTRELGIDWNVVVDSLLAPAESEPTDSEPFAADVAEVPA
jgi:glycosyltransferase involved in cell wall biosynthesis